MIHRLILIVFASLALIATPAVASADDRPTPAFSGATWGQDQNLTYRWKAGEVPPSWLQPLIHAAAGNVSTSRRSRAATFSFSSSGIGTVGYGLAPECGSGALACASRTPPSTFTIMFRRQGQQVDWGAIRWCQTYGTWPSGCFDAETSALHEFGHIEILSHIDPANYGDSVMSRVQAANPNFGWNQHAFGRCDVATLQKKYDMQTWSSPYSTCFSLATTASLTASAGTVRAGTSVTFTANVRTTADTSYERLADNPLHGRTVVLQRAAIGSATWVDVGTMTATPTAGRYTRAVTVNASYQWRVAFRPFGEGLRPVTSAAVVVRIG
jgi:hypothetical protein